MKFKIHEGNSLNRAGRFIVYALIIAMLSVVSFAACACGAQASADASDVDKIVTKLAAEGTDTITVNDSFTLPELVYVNGTKKLKGTGTLTGKSDYIIVVNDGASFTLDGVTISGGDAAGNGVYVSEKASFIMASGAVQNVKGVGVRVLGKASFNGGSISAAGENWLMLDTGASADVSSLECSDSGAAGIITAEGSSLSLGSGVSLTGSKSNLLYNGGKAVISGAEFGAAEDYAIHNDGELKIADTEFSGSEYLGYLDNAETGDCTIENSSMKDSKADFIYNFGKLNLTKVDFGKCTSTAIESRGSSSDITVTDCTMAEIGKTAFLCKNGKLTISGLEIEKCGGNGIHARGCEVNGKDITINECGGIGFLNDFPSDSEEAGVKSFTVDGFKIGHCVSYGIRSNGEYVIKDSEYGTTSINELKSTVAVKAADESASVSTVEEDEVAEVIDDEEDEAITVDSNHAEDDETDEVIESSGSDKPRMTLSNGEVGKSDSYGLYVKGGDVILNDVKFLGTNDRDRCVIQVGYSKNPGGRLTLNNVDVTGGKRGILNNSTLIMNSGNIHGNCIDNTSTSTGAGVYNAGTFIMNGGMIYGNACANSGGGVSNTQDAHFDMYGGIITQNSSEGYGGGVTNSGYFNLYNGTISKNISAKGGGGVRNACVAGLYGGVIKENTSAKNGGGLYCGGSDTCVSGVCIRDNISGNNGGGIYNAGKMDVQGTSSVTANTAAKNGGGVYNSGNLDVSEGVISGNTDAKNVAIYNYKGTLSVSGGKFEGEKYDIYLYGDVMNLSGNPDFDTMYRKSSKKTPAVVELIITDEIKITNKITITLSSNTEGYHVLNGDRELIAKYADLFEISNDPEKQYSINDNTESSKCGKLASAKVATINDDTKQYTWEDALEAADDGDTIKIFRNCAIDGSVIEKNITVQQVSDCDHIRIGGNDDSDDYAITISANVTFDGNSQPFKIIGNGTRGYTAIGVTAGKLTIDNGVISGIKNSGSKGAAIFVDVSGELSLNGGSISGCTSAGSGAAVYNKGTATVDGTVMSGNDCPAASSGIVNGMDINDYNDAVLNLSNVTAEDICLSNSATLSGNNNIGRLFLYNIKKTGSNSVIMANGELSGSITVEVIEGQGSGSYPNLFTPGTVIVESADGSTKLTENTLNTINIKNSKKVGDKELLVPALDETETKCILTINPELNDVFLFEGTGTSGNTVDGIKTLEEALHYASNNAGDFTVYLVKPAEYSSDFTIPAGKTISFYGNTSSSSGIDFGSNKLIVNGSSHLNDIKIESSESNAIDVSNGSLYLSGKVITSIFTKNTINLDGTLTEGSDVSVVVPESQYNIGTQIIIGNGIDTSCNYLTVVDDKGNDTLNVGADGKLTDAEAALISGGTVTETGDIDDIISAAKANDTVMLLQKSATINETTAIGKDITFTAKNDTDEIKLSSDISLSSNIKFDGVTLNANEKTVTVTSAAGRLYAAGGNVNFNNLNLTSNSGIVTDEAPIGVNSSASLTITGGTLSGLNAGKAGGAVSNAGVATLDSVTIQNCSSTGNGGAIFTSGSLTVKNSTITGCKSSGTSGNGGAIYVNASGSLNYSNTTISGCSVNGNGGAIYSASADVTLTSGTISNNSAKNGGGLATNSTGSIKLNGSEGTGMVITSNTASSSGDDVYDYGTVALAGNLKIGNLYRGNDAKILLAGALNSDKGAITISVAPSKYIEGEKILTPDSGVTNEQMTAAIESGAFAMKQRTSKIPLSISAVTDSSDNKVYGQLAIDTEAMLTSGENVTYGKFVKLVKNAKSGDTIKVCNSFELGSTNISLPAGLTIDGNGKTVSLNYNASGFAVSAGTVTVSKLNVTQTISKLTKGAFAVSGNGALTISDCVLTGNSSDSDTSKAGPAVNITGGSVTIKDTTISGFRTTGNGGAVYSSGGSVTIDGSIITGNEAKSGDAIYSGTTLNLQRAVNIDEIFLKDGNYITLTETALKKKTGGTIGVRVPSAKWIGDGTTKVLDAGTGTEDNFTGAIGRITLLNGKDYEIAKDGNSKGCLIAGEAVLNPDGTTPKYGKIDDLLDEAAAGDTIKLLVNAELTKNISKAITIDGGQTSEKAANTLTIKNAVTVSENINLNGITVTGETITIASGKAITANGSQPVCFKNITTGGDGQIDGKYVHLDGKAIIGKVFLAEGNTITFDGALDKDSVVNVTLEKFEDGAAVITKNDYLTSGNKDRVVLTQNAGLSEENKFMIDVSTGKLREPADAEIVGRSPAVTGSFANMISQANAEETVKLLRNVTLKNDVTIDKELTIDGSNGCTITAGTNSLTVSGSNVKFTNKAVIDNVVVTGTLTVDDSTVTTLTETSGTVTVQNGATVTTLNQNGGALTIDGSGTTVSTLVNNSGTPTFSNTPTIVEAKMYATNLNYAAVTGVEKVTLGADKVIELSSTPNSTACVTMDDFETQKDNGRQVITSTTLDDAGLLAASAYFTIGNENSSGYMIGTAGKVMVLQEAELLDENSTRIGLDTLTNALKTVAANNTINVLKSTSCSTLFYSTTNAQYTVDLNKNTVTLSNKDNSRARKVIIKNGTIDGNNKNLKITNAGCAITTEGDVNFKNLTVTYSSSSSKSTPVFTAQSGDLTLDNVNTSGINKFKDSTEGTILYSAGGKITLTNSSISTSSGTTAVYADSGTINIEGGTISSAIGANTGTLDISGGTVSGAISTGSGTVNISGDDTKVSGGISVSAGGTVNIKGGIISGDDKSISATGTDGNRATVNISGGSVSCAVNTGSYSDVTISGGTVTGVINAKNGTTKISGGTVESITSTSGTVTISGGTVNGDITAGSKKVTISSGATVNGNLTGYSGTATSGTVKGFVITGGTFKNDPTTYVDTAKYLVRDTSGTDVGPWTVSAKPKLTTMGARAAYTTPKAAMTTLNKCTTDKAAASYLSRLTVDQLDELYWYVQNNVELLEAEGVHSGERQGVLLGWINTAISVKGGELYSNLPTDKEKYQEYLNGLTPKQLAALTSWMNANVTGLSESEERELKDLIAATPYEMMQADESYLDTLDSDELAELRDYIIANNSEGGETSDAGIAMTDKVDAASQAIAEKKLAELEEAGTVKAVENTEDETEEGEGLTEEEKKAAAEKAELEATKAAWAAAQKYINSLSEEELRQLGLYIENLQKTADEEAQKALDAKTASENAAVGEDASEEAKAAADEAAKAAEEAAKAAEEAKKAAEDAEIYEDAVAVARSEKKIAGAKEGEFFAEDVLTVLLSKETDADRKAVIKESYTLANMQALLDVINEYDTTKLTEEKRVIFTAVKELVEARIKELTPATEEKAAEETVTPTPAASSTETPEESASPAPEESPAVTTDETQPGA